MNLRSVIVTLNFLLTSITAFAQYDYVQKLGALASVAMPDTPKLVDKNGVKAYVLNHNGVMFLANAAEVKGGLKEFFIPSKTDSIYAQFITGLIKTTGGNVLYEDKIKINGHPALQFSYKTILNGQQVYGYHRVVVLGDTLISCGVLSADLVPKNDENLAAFFNTFKVISISELEKIDASNTAYRFGEGIGTLMTIGFFIAIGFAILAFLKKIIYKKQKRQSP